MRKPLLIAMLIAALGGEAVASDGEIEISQTIALAGGVNDSLVADPAGFPVRITQPGSYRLTSDLAITVVTNDGIVIADGVDDVTIDLGGFTIRGVSGVNVGPPTWTCTGGGGGGVGSGIQGIGNNIMVRNGRIRNMGDEGIKVTGPGARVERMQLHANCGDGIVLGSAAFVDASQVRAHRFRGIWVGSDSLVSNSIALNNQGFGVEAGPGSIVLNNAASLNGSSGFSLGLGTNAIGNVANQNIGFGFSASALSAFSMNEADGNSAGGMSNGVASPCNVVNGVAICSSHP